MHRHRHEARTMLSLEVVTTPPAAGRARTPDMAVGEELLNIREYSGTPMKLEAFRSPGRSVAEGPRDGVA
jgi:hypothetical protein